MSTLRRVVVMAVAIALCGFLVAQRPADAATANSAPGTAVITFLGRATDGSGVRITEELSEIALSDYSPSSPAVAARRGSAYLSFYAPGGTSDKTRPASTASTVSRPPPCTCCCQTVRSSRRNNRCLSSAAFCSGSTTSLSLPRRKPQFSRCPPVPTAPSSTQTVPQPGVSSRQSPSPRRGQCSWCRLHPKSLLSGRVLRACRRPGPSRHPRK